MRTTLVVLLMVGLAFGAIDLASSYAPMGDGGPDGGGYYWYDQDHGGIIFSWTDISGSGTNLGLSDDSYSSAQALGFDFNFYGVTYTDIYVGSNGTVYFEDNYLGYGYTNIPGDPGYSGIVAFIAPWWRDLNPSLGSGAVYFEAFATYAVVQFTDVEKYGGGDPVTFQVILQEAPDSSTNSDFAMQYNSTTSLTGAMGFQGDATTGTELEYDPIDCVPGDLYYVSPTPNVAIEESTWGQIKAM